MGLRVRVDNTGKLKMFDTANHNPNLSGDAHVRILNVLGEHAQTHKSHDWKLWLIVIFCATYGLLAMWATYKKVVRKQAARAIELQNATTV